MRAIIYARFSSDNQREESITAQVRACTYYAEEKGYPVLKIYTDEARSATTDDRPGFLQMIHDIKNGLIKTDIVLVHKLDRFARNRYDSAFYRRELRQANVRLESVLEHLDDSPESVLLESLIEGIAEYYSKNLAREVMKGMRETAMQAKHCGGRPPLGYDIDKDKHYIINEAEARAVRLIFEMYAAGYGYGGIIKALSEQGYKSKLGQPFSKNSLHGILRNRKYSGIYTFNRTVSKSLDGKRNNHKSKNPEDIIEIPNAIPVIVPPEVFWKVQERMDKNQKTHASGRFKNKVIYLLSGLIECGECGMRMIGTSSSYRTRVSNEYRKRYYYECNNAKRTKGCGNEKINKQDVEKYVVSKLESEVLNKKTIPALAQKLFDQYKKDILQSANEGEYLNKEIIKVEKQIENIVEAITEGAGVIKALTEQLKKLENKKYLLESRLHEWRIKQEKELTSVTGITAYLKQYFKWLQSTDPVKRKQVVEKFVDRVIIKKDTIEVVFKVSVVLYGGGGGSRTHRPKEEPQDLLRA
ncbi:MAG: Recombinase [Pelotomaculum thermopropionicum]|uniref:Recombinase n=1 Tax=Pelotomaculum thermopropionicum TaxID=110500 RepID=A0A101HVU3_9FIRM|nr:MAG: Recombinase [Pelotomaculum thermopropionicum]